MNLIKVRFRIIDVTKVTIIIIACHLLYFVITHQLDGFANHTWHTEALLSAAGAVHGGKGSLLLLPEGWNHLLDPGCIIVTDVAQIARQCKDKCVSGAMLRFTAQQLYQLRYKR